MATKTKALSELDSEILSIETELRSRHLLKDNLVKVHDLAGQCLQILRGGGAMGKGPPPNFQSAMTSSSGGGPYSSTTYGSGGSGSGSGPTIRFRIKIRTNREEEVQGVLGGGQGEVPVGIEKELQSRLGIQDKLLHVRECLDSIRRGNDPIGTVPSQRISQTGGGGGGGCPGGGSFNSNYTGSTIGQVLIQYETESSGGGGGTGTSRGGNGTNSQGLKY